ncbi:MAG: hypothetical protein KDE27_10105 [Planctomycetes bacterium]|nr:hypothetical protein [Planctomycetota bacterium]
MVSVGSLLQLAAARVCAACGWLAFRVGLRQQARHQYERVLRLKGDDFSAYVHLGRIAYDTGDYAGWRREFEHARRADPVRFARLRHPFELFEPRLAGTTFEDTGERATWRSLRPFGAAQRVGGQPLGEPVLGDSGLDDSGLGDSDLGGSGLGNSGLGDSDLAGTGFGDIPAAFDVPGPEGDRSGRGGRKPAREPQDDCCSAGERERLHGLGPIRPEEVSACDVDDLADRLGCD